MEQIGCSLIDQSGTEIAFWGETQGQIHGAPDVVQLPNGDRVHGAVVGEQLQTWRLVPRMLVTGSVDGVAYDGQKIIVTRAPTAADVNKERDRRMSQFVFNGVVFDFDEVSRNRIDKARGSALAALMAGKQPGDLRWANADNDFGWIAADNTFHTMDAPTALAFGNAAAAWEGLHIVAGRNLKNMAPIPTNYASDQYWPTA